MSKEENNFKFPNNPEANKELNDMLFDAMKKCDRYNIIPIMQNGMLEIYEKNNNEPILLIYYSTEKGFEDILNFEFKNTHCIYHAEYKPKITLEELAQMFETFIKNRNNN